MPEFLEIPGFYGPLKPLRFEADVHDVEVVGEVPEELSGTYYRAGPDQQYPTRATDVLINGDGMVSMFRIADGHVDYKCRYVHTERFNIERAARKRLFGDYRNPYTDDPSVAGADRDNTGNTNAIVHGGKLFALREDSWPTELDPDTLETRGKWNFGGKLESKAMTAHPKLDPVTGELWSCGFFVRGRYDRDDMALQVVDRSGRLIREEFFVAPYPGLTHDFAVTRDHVIFPVMPLTVDVERMKRGGPFYAYDPDLPSCFGIMRRDGSTRDIRWFKVRQCFNGHIMNAFSEGSKVHLDGTIAPGNAFGFFPTVTGERSDPSQGIPTITRVTFDLASDDDGAVLTPFSAAIGEMPRCDPRREMSRYRYGYFKTRTGIVKLDWDSGSKTVHEMADSSAQEPVFVPRSADGAEDDGFILCVVNRPLEHRADLVILDAQNMTGPALATVKLPFDQPMAFHGNWVPVTRC